MSLILLLVGGVFLTLSNGAFLIPLAAWVAPVILLRFARTRKSFKGLWLLLGLHFIAYTITWMGSFPADFIRTYFAYLLAFVVIFGVLNWLPYVADRWLAGKVGGFASTLIFPLTWVALEFINGMVNPLLTWGSLAYTQHTNTELIQVASVTGMWGISFLVTWLAPVLNWAWEDGFEWTKVRGGVMTYAVVLIAVLMFGGVRTLFAPVGDTVRVASIIGSEEMEAGLPEGEVAFDDYALTSSYYAELLDYYIARTHEQAQAGAEIVVWQEYSFYVFERDEAAVIARGSEVAREEDIYLLMGFVTEIPDRHGELVENKIVWIAPDGSVQWEYLKAIPVPGSPDKAGNGIVPIQETPHGKIATMICYDMDQPALVRQAGQGGTDIMLVPAFDFGNLVLHTPMVALRAVENGFSVVRATGLGMITSYDMMGRVLATTDYRMSSDGILLSEVPTGGVWTLYPVIGDAFAWLSIVMLVGMATRGLVGSKRPSGNR